MNDFFKRMSWRLTGGIVTIALGAFAAAQAQKQDYDESQGLIAEQSVPSLDTPAWSNSLPIPIQAGPELKSSVLPAAFSMESPPSQFVSQVNHEEEQAAASTMQMPLPDQESPAAAPSGPSMFMPPLGMPEVTASESAPQDHAAPAMQMPAIDQPPAPESMPEIQFDQGPSMEGFGGPAADASPMMPAQIEPAVPQPDMAMPQPAAAPQSFVGDSFAGDVGNEDTGYNEAPAMNSLRDGLPSGELQSGGPQSGTLSDSYSAQQNFEPAQRQVQAISPYAAETRQTPEQQYAPATQYDSQYDVAAQRQMPLPSLPEPPQQPNQFAPLERSPYGQPESGYRNDRINESVPARFAGHQSMGLPPGVNNDVPSSYLQDRNDPMSTSLPGDRNLEGVQSPSVVIHKRAPAEVKVGKPATFVIQVRNVGTAEALNVEVHDSIPTGMQLVDATPQPLAGSQNGTMVWQLGAMPAGDERSITMQLVPREEGELGSVARVTFEAAASVRTRSTRPELKITQRAPQKVLIGQQLEIELEIANIGTGEATGVILQEDVPEGLDHPRGRQLDNALGSLRPGETRREILRLRAVEPGMIRNIVHLVAEDAKEVTHAVDVEVVAPVLGVQLSGPNRRFLERQATYMVNIQNAGTAPATNVEVIAYLDRGFTFVSTENNGTYDSNRHAVLWSIVNLPPGDSGSVPLTLLPVEQGEQAIRLEAIADLDTRAQSESTVSVESQAELTFSIADTADPIELGSETTYEIKVQNSGSRNDTNVQVRMIVPPGIELLEADSDVETDGRGGVAFAPHKNLAAGGDLTYRIRVRGVQPNTHIIKAIVTSDQARVPVTKEESTMVYADR